MTDELQWSDVRPTLRLEDVENALGLDVTQVGDEDFAECPLPDHPSATDSGQNFSINREELLWNCFVCGEGGVIPELVAAINDCTYKEAVKWLAEFSDADSEDDTERFVRQLDRWAEPRKEPLQERGGVVPWFPPDSCDEYRDNLGAVEDLLDEKWGIQLETARDWTLGHDPAHERDGYVGPALIIPHWFRRELVGWQERWLQDNRPKNLPKYTNTPGFPRSNTIFGWDRVKPRIRHIVLVESVMTVIRLAQENIPAVATFGGSINEAQLRLLRTCDRGITYSPDEGEVGQRAARKVIAALAHQIAIKVAAPPDKHKGDLADLTGPEIRAVLDSATPSFLF